MSRLPQCSEGDVGQAQPHNIKEAAGIASAKRVRRTLACCAPFYLMMVGDDF
jgi:hypothetical protein